MPYRSLNPQLIVDTVENLTSRIGARFGGRGLTRVAQELADFAHEDVGRAKRLGRPRFFLRTLVYLVIFGGLSALAYIAWTLKIDIQTEPSFEMFEGIDALINILLVMGAGIFFLLNLETRSKRHAVLKRINQLRSLAHVIDMHQISKDPMPDLHNGEDSESAPESDLHGYELVRYLDYCADLLVVSGKLAAVYLEYSDDPVVISSVNDFESLTGEMARKIWQKVTVLELQDARGAPTITDGSIAETNKDQAQGEPVSEEQLQLPDFLK